MSVKIIVDVHECRSGITETLAELGAEIEIASLPAGDYAVGADTLVERKRVLDLHGAVLNGRLWPQLGKLRAGCVSQRPKPAGDSAEAVLAAVPGISVWRASSRPVAMGGCPSRGSGLIGPMRSNMPSAARKTPSARRRQ